ncbi:MAG: TetR/AcrR family transcriptional regulator [Actinomycetota bacterium]|nr:TetR/AcrR family transcriptional regulator [Actinomycetota bacterium]
MAKRAEYLGPERRRPLVLDAAQAIFAEGGFTDASMAAIAERAAVSKAVLYDCFPGGKQEIYYALLDRGEEVFMQHMMGVLDHTNRLPLEEALREGIAAFLDYAELNPNGFRIIFGDAGTSDPEIARRTERTKELMVAKMGERTRQIMTEAGVPITPLADTYNRSIVAVAEEMARWTLRDPTIPKEALVETLVAWFMKGFESLIPGDSWRRPLP